MKKLLRFIKDYYFLLGILLCVFFVAVVAGYKLFIKKPTFLYTRVKIGQGLWWLQTSHPSLWYINSIQAGDEQRDLLGEPIATVVGVRHYPVVSSGPSGADQSDQYDGYIDLKLKVSGNKKTGEFSFNRSTIGVGSSIDLQFPSSQFSGTITDMSLAPLENPTLEKTVYLAKRNASQWEYDTLRLNDTYFDGVNTVFKVLDKSYDGSTMSVKARIKVKQVGSSLIFGEEQVVNPGKSFNVSLPSISLSGFIVTSIN